MAAVHVVADPLAAINPTLEVALDWDATLAYRHYLWSLGLAVAEAMDTSQRGMGFDWGRPGSSSSGRGRSEDGARRGLASGAGTDHLEPGPRVTLADVEAAYEEQCAWIEGCGGRIILMASRALAACGQEPGRLREGLRPHPRPGARAGDHPLARRDVRPRAGRLLGLARPRPRDRDAAGHRERARRADRRREDLAARSAARDRDAAPVPPGVRMYTGDDFDYPTTIRGDGERASDALLGIFDVIAPAASAALKALDGGDLARYEAILWRRRSRCHVTSSARPRASTRPASSSRRTSTATRPTSGWSAAWRARARSCTSPSSSC